MCTNQKTDIINDHKSYDPFSVTFYHFTAAHWLSGTTAELHVDQTTNQMVPEGHNLTDVGSPGRVEAEAAQLLFTDTTP